MRNRIAFFLLFLFSGIVLFGRGGREVNPYIITGLVTETDHKQALAHTSVKLLQADSSFVAGTRTDEEGVFHFRTDHAGSYLVWIDCAGYESVCRPVTLDKEHVSVDLGTLVLEPSATMLQDLEVTAARKQITMKGDTLVYNADAFRVPPGSTLGTLLNRLPGVTIEGGVIKYHGKEVNKLLINGKEFFSGDLTIALENLPTEIVENIQAYETKTDEDKQKRTDSGERLNVLDVTIKKEYMSTWIGNTDLAAGTYDHYSARLFLTRFTDRLSVSAFGQINNLNDQSEANPNGGWRSSNWNPGLNTFRKMGVNASWDNGKKEEEAGYLKLFGSARASHDNLNTEQEVIGETFYPGASRSYNNSLNGREESRNNASLEGGISWQVDTVTYLYGRVNFSHEDKHVSGYERAATFNADPYKVPGVTDPLVSLFSAEPNDSLLRTAVNRNDMNSLSFYNSNNFSAQLSAGRRLSNKGNRLHFWSFFRTGKKNTKDYSLSDIRYYSPEAEEPRRINNQHSLSPNIDRRLDAQLAYEHVLSKAQRLTLAYVYMHMRTQNDYTLYQLDSLDSWRNTGHPVGSLPSADSLAMAINHRNSTYATHTVNAHGMYAQYQLINKKNFDVTASVILAPIHQKMSYKRESLDTVMVDNRFQFNPYFLTKYKLKNGFVQVQYYGYPNFPELTQMLDVTDDRNPLVVIKGNPDLKTSWTHRFNLNFQTTFGERKASVWAHAGYQTTDTEVSNTETYDPVTGVRTIRPENVDGSWNMNANLGANIPLDAKQRVNISPSFDMSYRRGVGFFTSTEDNVSLLNEQKNYEYTPRLNLSYRIDGFYIAMNNSYSIVAERNSLQPGADQTSRTLSTGIEGQYEFPFGMILFSEFGLYGRRGFSSEMMNRDQWLWNASVSQAFLKKKTLVLTVEARDILGQRVNQWVSSSNYSRSAYYSNAFRNMNYVMFHLIYRFSVGKKAT